MIEAGTYFAATPRVSALDTWVRGRSVELNTQLEELYATQESGGNVTGVGDDIEGVLHDEGRELIVASSDANLG